MVMIHSGHGDVIQHWVIIHFCDQNDCSASYNFSTNLVTEIGLFGHRMDCHLVLDQISVAQSSHIFLTAKKKKCSCQGSHITYCIKLHCTAHEMVF